MLKRNFHSQRFFKMWSAAAAVGLLACIAFSSPTSAATYTLAELAAGQTFTIGSVEFVDWVFENPTVDLNVATVDTIDDVNLPGFQVNGNGELSTEVELEYTFTVRTTNDEPLIRGALLEITAYSAAPESEINVKLEGQNNFAGLKLETFVNDLGGDTVLQDGQGVEPPVASLPLRSKVILDIAGLDPAEISLDTYTTQIDVTNAGSGNQPPVADAGGPVTGEAGVEVSFDGSASSDPDGEIVKYKWDYGDGTKDKDAGPKPSHTYTENSPYHVTLTVTDDKGVTSSDSTVAFIGLDAQPPVADAGGPYSGAVGVAVEFDGSDSIDPDGEIVTYTWDFGDGETGSGKKPSHTYDTAGIYRVTLEVTDNDDATNSDETVAIIATGNLPPQADAGGPYAAVVGEVVSFNGGASSDPDGGDIVDYAWYFGDGETGSGKKPSHTYDTADQYTVILTVTDEDGATNSDDAVVTVDGRPPVADGDSDGVADDVDNCPAVPNPFQQDTDRDGRGDLCDTDNDNDGLTDDDEVNTYDTNPADADTDNDGMSDGYEVEEGLDPLDSSDCPDWICSQSNTRGWRLGIGL